MKKMEDIKLVRIKNVKLIMTNYIKSILLKIQLNIKSQSIIKIFNL